MKLSDYVDEVELKRLLQGLMAFVVAILIFTVFAMLVVPGLRKATTPAMPGPIEGVGAETGWLDPTEVPATKGYEKPPVDPKTLMEPGPELLAKGKALFVKNCVQCHGAEGKGDGLAGAGLNPPVRNFTSPEKWKPAPQGPSLPGIFKTLSEGSPNTAMASFSYLSVTNRMALAHIVLSYAKFPRTDDPAALAALSASLGKAPEKVPAKIPLSLALKKLVAESTSPPPLAAPVSTDLSPGAEVFRRVVADPSRVAVTLSRSPIWKNGITELATVVVQGAPGNGFAVSSNTLGKDEWQALLNELSQMAGRP